MNLKFVDLFAGIGGIRLGFEQALLDLGLAGDCVFSSEVHPEAQRAYSLNFNEVPYGDIREIEELPEHDVLLAGFPCQSFSYAGKQEGFADIRGTLFFEINRLLAKAKIKPRVLILENVRGFTTHDKGRTFATVKQSLERLGYGVQTILLNSAMFGVPQNRVRAYIVCFYGGVPQLPLQSNVGYADSHKYKVRKNQKELFLTSNNLSRTVSDILSESTHPKYECSEKFTTQLLQALDGKPLNSLHGVRLIDSRGGNSIHSWDMGLKGKCSDQERKLMKAIIKNRRRKVFGTEKDGKRLSEEQIKTFWTDENLSVLLKSLTKKRYLSLKNGTYNPVAGNMSFEVFKFLDPESISITVVSTDAHRLGVVQSNVPRRITPRECARLQGFPDSFKLHSVDKWAYHQLGNSVSVPVVFNVVHSALTQLSIQNLPSCGLLSTLQPAE